MGTDHSGDHVVLQQQQQQQQKLSD
jgi:hypothetical protein